MKPKSVEGSDFLSSMSQTFLTCAILLIIIGVGLPSIYADNFGIIIDNTCKTMLKNNISSNCPTYEDIITLFPDTSNQDVSGKFGYYNGIYQRGPEKLFNSFEYYRFWNSSFLFIDPPVETGKRIKLIEIKANLDQYLLHDEKPSYNGTEHSLTMGVGRFIDSCRTAYIDSKDWPYLLGDTFFHMRHDCSSNSTSFISKTTVQLDKVKHDISTSYKYKLKAWQDEMVLKCGKKVCLYEKDQPTPP